MRLRRAGAVGDPDRRLDAVAARGAADRGLLSSGSAAIVVMIALPFIGHTAKGATRWLESRRLHPAAVGVHEAGPDRPGRLDVRRGPEGAGRAGRLHRLRPVRRLTVGLLLIQPDVGQTVLITIAFGAAFFMAGVPLTWVMLPGRQRPWRGWCRSISCSPTCASRVDRFLSPETADTHQVDRAAEAIAAGGLFGRGPGEGVMKRHVPDLHTDFIYSVGAEEFGLVFSPAPDRPLRLHRGARPAARR